ncbi:MAG: glycosyltransferase family 9 protein [Calditrichaceae bacterium]
MYFATASTLDKTWPEKNFVKLIKYSIEQHPEMNHVLLAGLADWEIEAAQRIRQKVNMDQLHLIQGGDTTNNVIANAKLLVSCDTGIRSLAIAYETPTLGIFPLSDATAFGYRPYFGQHVIVRSHNHEPVTFNDCKKWL